jgi:hypothetical protein
MKYGVEREDTVLGCVCLGAGLIAGATGTIWGGYELGSAINDLIGVTSTVGRGALDLLVMGSLAVPSFSIGVGGGLAAAGLGQHVKNYYEGRKARNHFEEIRKEHLEED